MLAIGVLDTVCVVAACSCWAEREGDSRVRKRMILAEYHMNSPPSPYRFPSTSAKPSAIPFSEGIVGSCKIGRAAPLLRPCSSPTVPISIAVSSLTPFLYWRNDNINNISNDE